jgi:hypothetical protein
VVRPVPGRAAGDRIGTEQQRRRQPLLEVILVPRALPARTTGTILATGRCQQARPAEHSLQTDDDHRRVLAVIAFLEAR